MIEVKAHGGLRRIEGGNFRVQNGLPGVFKGGLNIIPCQFRVAAEQRIPGFTLGKLFQDGGDRNSGVFDDWLAATDTWIDFNALSHVLNHTRAAWRPQAPDDWSFTISPW